MTTDNILLGFGSTILVILFIICIILVLEACYEEKEKAKVNIENV